MTLNRDVFVRDPLTTRLPNDGVAQVGEPRTAEQWAVLRHELETFVCEGEYRRGLDSILGSYLANLGKETQPAVWVSGYFGSGKSHLVRVLEYMWRNTPLPDGVNARDLTNLADDIREHLRELTVTSRRHGGLWSAAGTLNASVSESVRLALLAIVFKSAGLHEKYPQARFMLWLMREGLFDALAAAMHERGRNLGSELSDMYVSTVLAESLRSVRPDFAPDNLQARIFLRAQYPPVRDISNEEMLVALEDVLRLRSDDATKRPCTLIVLDELQQFVGPSADRAAQVQEVVQACSARLGTSLLFVATGQNALHDTEQLAKIQDRFTVSVSLATTDVERVVREVVLRKKQDQMPPLQALLDRCSGEISKQLPGSRIAPIAEDAQHLVADYPLLPVRQRFWEHAIRAVDRSGHGNQLRSQLRIAYEAIRDVADAPLGTVIGGDFLYSQIATRMVGTGMMLREDYEAIENLRGAGTEDGMLQHRACATVYLIGKLTTDGGTNLGLQATVETLADLLTTDLMAGSAPLRAQLPDLLNNLVERGVLVQVENEYRLQTGEGKIWDGEYRSRASGLRGDTARLFEERTKALHEAVQTELKGIVLTQGASKAARKLELSFETSVPTSNGGVPVWIRDEWSGTTLRAATEEAHRLGSNSPVVTVWLPRVEADAVRRELVGWLAASETLDARGVPTSEAGEMARAAMRTKWQKHREGLDQALATVLRDAKVLPGGGTEVSGLTLAAAVTMAAEAGVVRLYPQFKDADHEGWGKVAERARSGDTDALERVGYGGDVASHPVCKHVLDFVGMSGKRGKAIRDHFAASPYGWPREAVDGALTVLSVSGNVRATQNGATVPAKQISTTVVATTDFRRESVTITLPQRLAVQGVVLALTGKKVAGADDVALAAEARTALLQLRDLAASAGGPAPCPAPPDATYLEDLLARQGNDLLAATASEATRLREESATWTIRRDAIAQRMKRWRALEQMLAVADGLAAAEPVRGQADAVRDQRALLSDPDPVPPLCTEIAAGLRGALAETYERYSATYDAAMVQLAHSEAWRRLGADEAESLLAAHLSLASAPAVGSDADLLASLTQTSLTGWRDRTDALSQRFARVAADAVQKLTPAAVPVTFPSRTLVTEGDVADYLDEIRAQIMKHVAAGKPVIV